MEYTKLKKVVITSLLSGSIVLSVGIAANASNFTNDQEYSQYKIEDYAIKPKRHKLPEKFNNALNSLVERKVITKEKSEEIKVYLKKTIAERKNEYSKIKGMSEEQKKEYFKNNKKERKSIIEKMIEDGVITEHQGAELRKALKECKR